MMNEEVLVRSKQRLSKSVSEGFKWFQMYSGGFWGFLMCPREFYGRSIGFCRRFYAVSSQGVSGCFSGFHRVSGAFQGFQGVSGVFKGSQGRSRCVPGRFRDVLGCSTKF